MPDLLPLEGNWEGNFSLYKLSISPLISVPRPAPQPSVPTSRVLLYGRNRLCVCTNLHVLLLLESI